MATTIARDVGALNLQYYRHRNSERRTRSRIQTNGIPTANAATRGIVLGTDFITDILLISLTVEDPILLSPSFLATDIALRTVSEAVSKAARLFLELEPSELQAEYVLLSRRWERPANKLRLRL